MFFVRLEAGIEAILHLELSFHKCFGFNDDTSNSTYMGFASLGSLLIKEEGHKRLLSVWKEYKLQLWWMIIKSIHRAYSN